MKQIDCCMSRITGHMSWQQPLFVRFFSVFTLFALDSNNYFLLVSMSNVLLGAMKKSSIYRPHSFQVTWVLPACACSLGKKGYLNTLRVSYPPPQTAAQSHTLRKIEKEAGILYHKCICHVCHWWL